MVDVQTWLDRTIPRLYNCTVSCYLRWGVQHKGFTYCFDLLILVNAGRTAESRRWSWETFTACCAKDIMLFNL